MNIAIILSGGIGSRMNSSSPKQFLKVNGTELVCFSILTFYEHHDIDEIVLVAAKGYEDEYRKIIDKFTNKPIHLVQGGESRSESSYLALKYLKELNRSDDIVLIHDGARPLVSHRIIEENLQSVTKNVGVLTYLDISDSVFMKDGKRFRSTLSRDGIGIAQTPQSFILNDIYKAYESVINQGYKYTDDIQVFKSMFDDIILVKGDKMNLKVTTKEDLLIMKALLDEYEASK